MATWPNIIDDDGSGTTGTVLNDALFDQIKAYVVDGADGQSLRGPLRYPQALGIPMSISVNDWNPPGGPAAVVWIVYPSAAGLYATGLMNEPDGATHLLINGGVHPLLLVNQNAGSAAANRFIGPGFADYALGVWRSAWIYYALASNAWIIQAP